MDLGTDMLSCDFGAPFAKGPTILKARNGAHP